MRVAIIENGIVVNVIMVDTLDENHVQSDTANIGDSLVDGVFIPEEIQPQIKDGNV
jgi:hypothetical protein